MHLLRLHYAALRGSPAPRFRLYILVCTRACILHGRPFLLFSTRFALARRPALCYLPPTPAGSSNRLMVWHAWHWRRRTSERPVFLLKTLVSTNIYYALRGSNGAAWAVARCGRRRAGRFSLAAKATKAAPGEDRLRATPLVTYLPGFALISTS